MELESVKIIVLTLTMTLGMSSIPETQDRVVGGKKAERGMFPYVAGIKMTFVSKYDSKTIICTGTILTERWILTAGHCCTYTVYTVEKGYTLLRGEYTVGEVDLRRNLKCISGNITHPNYYVETIRSPTRINVIPYNDLCLVKTKEKIEFDKFVNKVFVSNSNTASGRCFTVGFGKLINPNETANEQNWLMYYAILNYKNVKPEIPNTMMLDVVYGFPSSGDSGGPLICNGMQLGVASSVEAVGKTALLTYMITGKYKDWIEEVVRTEVIDACNTGDGNSATYFFFGICCAMFLLTFN